MSKRSKRWLIVAFAASAIIAVILVYRVRFIGSRFDSVVWRDETQLRRGVRLEMADRLIARGTLNGRTRSEVVDLLGEPPPTEYFAEWNLVYWLGPERGFISIDSEWLVLRLGKAGRVVEVRIVRD